MWKRGAWRHLALIAALAFALGPLIVLFSNGLKPREEFMTDPLGFPGRLAFENLSEAWTKGAYGQAFITSIIVGAVCIMIISVAAGMAAYALAKLQFKGSGFIMAFLLFTMSVPMGLFLVPLFFIWKQLQLMDTLQGIILVYSAIFLPFNIFLLRSFFVGIPNDLLDSGRVDGCNEWKLITRIMFPISRPAFLTVALLIGLWTWNEFFFANALLQSQELKTVATRYLVFTGRFNNDWTMISAAGLISIFPVVVAYLLLQRKFIEGIAEGSVKG